MDSNSSEYEYEFDARTFGDLQELNANASDWFDRLNNDAKVEGNATNVCNAKGLGMEGMLPVGDVSSEEEEESIVLSSDDQEEEHEREDKENIVPVIIQAEGDKNNSYNELADKLAALLPPPVKCQQMKLLNERIKVATNAQRIAPTASNNIRSLASAIQKTQMPRTAMKYVPPPTAGRQQHYLTMPATVIKKPVRLVQSLPRAFSNKPLTRPVSPSFMTALRIKAKANSAANVDTKKLPVISQREQQVTRARTAPGNSNCARVQTNNRIATDKNPSSVSSRNMNNNNSNSCRVGAAGKVPLTVPKGPSFMTDARIHAKANKPRSAANVDTKKLPVISQREQQVTRARTAPGNSNCARVQTNNRIATDKNPSSTSKSGPAAPGKNIYKELKAFIN